MIVLSSETFFAILTVASGVAGKKKKKKTPWLNGNKKMVLFYGVWMNEVLQLKNNYFI